MRLKCRYCASPIADDGSINHCAGCRGLKQMDLNRLEYDNFLDFLRAFISGGVNQDFKPWARTLYEKMRLK